jgi:pectinesterase
MWSKNLKLILFIFILTSEFDKVSAQTTDTIIISKDKESKFSSIQQAFNSIDCQSAKTVVFYLKKGIYKEKLVLYPTKAKVILIGESRDSSIISYDDFSGKVVADDTLSTHTSFSFRVLSDFFEMFNITVKNTAGTIGQAVAIEIKSDCVFFRNCRFLGNQDTFYANSEGRLYVQDCYIEGTTDFIFGKSIVLFDSCTIFCKKNSFITAASTPENTKSGFVFRNCRILADTGVHKVYLGRPWRSFAQTVFLNCYLGSFIVPEGWNNWSKSEKEKTAFYAEYKSFGPGASNISRRVKWSHQLTESEALAYSIKNIFSKTASNINFPNNWIPR